MEGAGHPLDPSTVGWTRIRLVPGAWCPQLPLATSVLVALAKRDLSNGGDPCPGQESACIMCSSTNVQHRRAMMFPWAEGPQAPRFSAMSILAGP